MTFATAVPILFTSFVNRTNVYWSVIHGIKRKPHLSVVWNWYHFVAIAILHQPRPTDSADINTRLQLSDTSSIPPMHGGFLLTSHRKNCDNWLSVPRYELIYVSSWPIIKRTITLRCWLIQSRYGGYEIGNTMVEIYIYIYIYIIYDTALAYRTITIICAPMITWKVNKPTELFACF